MSTLLSLRMLFMFMLASLVKTRLYRHVSMTRFYFLHPCANFKRFCVRGTLCDEYMTWHEFGFVVVLDKFNRKKNFISKLFAS